MLREETPKAQPSEPGSHVNSNCGCKCRTRAREGDVRKRMDESRRHALSDLNQKLTWDISGMTVTSSAAPATHSLVSQNT